MALTKMTKDMAIIQALDDEPNDVGGLTAQELKEKFDEAGETIKKYLNETLTSELDTALAGTVPTTRTVNRHPLSADVIVTKSDVGLGNVENTSDADKPVSTQQKAALMLKANKTDVLEKENTTPFTPSADYHPATKKYVDDTTSDIAIGILPDKSVTSEKLADGSVTAEKMANQFYANVTHTHLPSDLITAVPISKGGTGKTTAAEALAALGGVSAASLAAYDKTIKGTYPIATGNSVAAGDVVDVVDALVPVMKPLGEYTEGDIVQLNENGVPVDFYVAKHDYEAALNGSGRTLLVRKLSDNNSGNDYVWNSSSFNNLSGSTIDTTLNNTYKARFDKSVQVAMATTKFYYTIGNGDTSIGTLERSIFLLSNTEIGGTQESYLNIEGETLPIASVLKTSNVDNYSRSVVTTNAQSVMYFTASGGHGSLVANKARAARPCFTLPNTFLIDTGEKIQTGEKEITRSIVAEANVKTILQGLNVSRLDVCMLTDTVGVAAYGATNSQCRSFKVDGAKITPVGIDSFYNGPINGVSLARLSDTKIVVSWSISSQIYTRLATIVESSISFKNTVQPTGNGSDYPYIVALDTDRFAIFYSSVGANSIAVNVGTVSGDTITYPGNGYSKSGYDPKNISATLLPNDSSGNKRVCVCFVDVNDNKGKAVIATINSSNAVTWGSVVTFNAGPIYNRPDCCLYNSETVVVAYAQSGTGALATSLLVSGSSISVGDTSDSLTNSGNDMAVENVGKKIVVVTTDHNIKGAAYLLSLDNNFSLLDSFAFNSLGATAPSIGKIDNYRFVLAFGDSSNSNYLTSTILEVNGNQIAGGFTVNSTQAIALQSGEAGQEIEVIFAGTTAADFVTEGQAIPSDGVYGYGPVAGWLNVIPYWAKDAGLRIATGSYVGTGSYGESNPNTLNFDSPPKVVVIGCDKNQSGGSSSGVGVFISPSENGIHLTGNTKFQEKTTWAGKSISWYVFSGTAAGQQFNESGTTYYFFAVL